MTAVLIQRRDSASGAAARVSPPHLRLYQPDAARVITSGAGRGSASRAGARSVRGGRRLDAAVYRRRRLLALGLLLLSIAAVAVLAQLIQAGTGGGPLTATGAAAGPGMVQAGAAEYVVHRGDSLWTIAASLEPGRDPRPMVDRLARVIGGTSLYPGEVISVPAGR